MLCGISTRATVIPARKSARNVVRDIGNHRRKGNNLLIEIMIYVILLKTIVNRSVNRIAELCGCYTASSAVTGAPAEVVTHCQFSLLVYYVFRIITNRLFEWNSLMMINGLIPSLSSKTALKPHIRATNGPSAEK